MFDPLVGKIPWRREWLPIPVFLPGESHGQRGLVGYSPWGRKESDTTERLHFTSLHTWSQIAINSLDCWIGFCIPSYWICFEFLQYFCLTLWLQQVNGIQLDLQGLAHPGISSPLQAPSIPLTSPAPHRHISLLLDSRIASFSIFTYVGTSTQRNFYTLFPCLTLPILPFSASTCLPWKNHPCQDQVLLTPHSQHLVSGQL